MNEDNLVKLHGSLVENGYQVPALDQFAADMQDSTKAQKLYNSLAADGYKLPGDFNTFYNDIAVTPPTQKEEGSLLAYPDYALRNVVKTVNTLPAMLGRVDERINRALPESLQTKNYKSPLTGAAEAVDRWVGPGYLNEEQQNSLPGQVMQGLGSAGGILTTAGLGSVGAGAKTLQMAETAVPSIAKIVGQQLVKPTAFVGGSMTAMPEYDAAKKAGLSDDDAFKVMLKNYFVGQTEALPLENMLGNLNRITGGGITKNLNKYISGIFEGGITEAIQEGVQTYLTNKIAQGDYDPDRDPLWGIAQSMAVGGLVGMIIPGIGGAIKSLPPDARAKVERKVAEIQQTQAATQQVDNIIGENTTGDPQLDKQIDTNAALSPEQLALIENKKMLVAQEEGAIEQKEKVEQISKEVAQADTQAARAVDLAVKEDEAKAEEQTPEKKEGEPAPETKPLPVEEQTAPALDAAHQEAIAQVKALQERFAAADPNEDLGDLYRQLANAKHSLLQIAGTTKKPKTTEVQNRIESDTGVSKQEPVTMSPFAALKHQIQTFYRGVGEGVRRGAEGKNELVAKVQEVLKAQPNITAKQASTILTKVKRTNLSTPGSISKLNNFIDKVSKNAEYAEQLDEANQLRRRIKGKSKGKNATFREKEALKRFSAVDPEETDINNYLTTARQVNQSFSPAVDRPVLNIADTHAYADSVEGDMEQARQRKEAERRERLSKKLGLTEEEINILDSDSPLEGAIKDENKKAALREEFLGLATDAKEDVPGDLEGLTDNQKKDVEALKNVDLSLLSTDQLKFYVKAVDRLATNSDFGGLGNFTAIVKAQEDFKVLQEKMKDSNILNLNQMEANIDSLPVALQAITGLPEDAAMFQLYFGIKGVSDASVNSLTAEQDFVKAIKEMEKTLTKAYGKNNNGFGSDSIVRQGIYSELIRYAEDQDPNEALAATKEAIEHSIESHRAAGESEEAAKVEELYKPFKDAHTIEEVQKIMQNIDPAGHKIIEKTIELYAPYADKVAEYNERFFNKPTVKSINYSGPRRWRKKGSTDQVEDVPDVNVGDINSYISAISKPKQTSSAKEFKNMVQPGAALDFNKHHNMANGIKRVVFAMDAITPMIQVRQNLKDDAAVKDLFGSKKGDDKAIKKANSLYSKIFNPGTADGKDAGAYFDFERHAAGRAIPSEVDRSINKIFAPLRKIGYTLSLSGFSQVPKQATVLANVMINLGGDADLLAVSDAFDNSKEMNEFLKGETVSMRGSQKSSFSLGELTNTSKGIEAQKNIDKFIENSFEGWLGIKPLVATDVAMAKMTYLSFYKQYLRQQRVKFEGLSAENSKREDKVRQEARAYAKQRTDALQVVSNPSELGIKMKDQSFAWQAVKAALVPFGTFSSNSKSRMWADVRALVNGNPRQRRAAARDLAGTMTEQGVFQTTSGLMKLYLWGAAAQYIGSLFNLPEPTKKDEKKAWEAAVKTWKTNLIIDFLPVIMTAPGEKAFVGLVNSVANRWMGADDPLYKYKGSDDPVEQFNELSGVYGVAISRLMAAENVAEEALTGVRRAHGKEKKLTKEQENFAAFMAGLYGLNLLGKMPADVLFALDKVRKQQKPGKH